MNHSNKTRKTLTDDSFNLQQFCLISKTVPGHFGTREVFLVKDLFNLVRKQ